MLGQSDEEIIKDLDKYLAWTQNTDTRNCKTCQWSNYDEGDTEIVCGHHITNFTADSSCADWQDPKDPEFLAKIKKDASEIRKKMEGNK